MNREIFAYGASLAVVLAAVVAGHYVYDPGLSAFAKGLAPGVIAFFQAITHLGVATWSLVGSALLAVYFHFIARNRILAGRMMYLFASVAGSGLVVDAIKWLAGRWRPNAFAHRGLYGFELFGFGYDQTSFPSGHAATICSMAVALAVLYPRFRWVWGAVAVLVCVSRVVIGAHYPSDVIMGAYVGISAAFLLRKVPIFKKVSEGRKGIESGNHQNN